MPTSSLPHQGRRIWFSVGSLALEGVVDAEMVLQVGADIGVGVHDGNAEALQQRGRADAGKLQKLRRVDRAAARG